MITASDAALEVRPSQTRPHAVRTARRNTRRPALIVGGLLLAALVTLGARASTAGWFRGFFGDDSENLKLHVVEPSTLNIMLVEDGELKPRESIELKCEVEGQSTIVTVVDESARVKKGDLLIELAAEQLAERMEMEQIELRKIETDFETVKEDLDIQLNQNASDIKKAELDWEIAKLDLQKYQEGDAPQKLKSADLDIEQTLADIKRKTDELEKNRRLHERGWVTKMHIEQLEFELRKAEMTLERHQLSKRILLEYEKPKDLMQKESNVERMQEELERVQKRAESRKKQAEAKVEHQRNTLELRQKRFARLQDQLEKCKIYAPVDGIIQYPEDGWRWGGGERIAAGQRVHEGQTLLVLPDTSQMLVNTRIHEADRHQVSEGMPCIVTVSAVPGKTFTGKIAKIEPFADSENRWLNPELKEHTTEILLDEVDAELSPGDSAEVQILIATIVDSLAVPVQCVYSNGPQSFVFVENGSSAEPVEVTLGHSTSSMVEVKEGVERGDRVRLQIDDELLAKLPDAPPADATAEIPAPGDPEQTQPGLTAGPQPGKNESSGHKVAAGPGSDQSTSSGG